MKRWHVAVLSLILVGALAGCSSGGPGSAPPETIDLTVGNVSYGTREITLEKGKSYQLVLANKDGTEHDFSIDKIPVKIVKEGHEGGHGSGSKKPDLHVHADAHKTESVVFTPVEAGTYTYYCTIPGHKESGMVGKLTVK